MVALVQIAVCDTAPSNVGNLGGVGDAGGGHLCIASMSGFQAGNYLLGFGGTPNFAGTRAVKFSDPVNGDWTTLWHLNCASAPGGVSDGLDSMLTITPVGSSIAPGFSGTITASGAGTATITAFDGTVPNLSTLVGSTFLEIRNGVTGTVTSITGAGHNVVNFTGGGTPPVGNPAVVGGFIKFVVTSAGEDYTAGLVWEISATSGLVTSGSSSAQNSFTAAATVNTGTVPAWSGSALAISVALDDNDDGTSPYNPLSATGNNDGVYWKWNLATAILRAQHQLVSSPGSAYSMNFTTQTADHHQAYLAVFADAAASDTLMGAICL